MFTGLLECGKREGIEMHAGFRLENLRRGSLVNRGIEGRIILKQILQNWIHLYQVTGKQVVLLKMAMHAWVS